MTIRRAKSGALPCDCGDWDGHDGDCPSVTGRTRPALQLVDAGLAAENCRYRSLVFVLLALVLEQDRRRTRAGIPRPFTEAWRNRTAATPPPNAPSPTARTTTGDRL